ncbi:polysaccharide biosynthesis/export family protein [Sphingomonas sp. MMS24-J13]|uniref:polysaccharide biosynthesis/export family protein n=1 Tax=Sphingomonas sp. MMS24-J13 TaxID=3238686 RepID=UPI00384C55A2
MKISVAIVLGLVAQVGVAQAQAPAKPAAATYHISAGDQLDIYVWGDERLQRSMNVLPDGTIAFPLAGTVAAAGRTPAEVESDLSKLLAPQYKGVPPQVTVSVKMSSGMQVSVIGKVRTPGNFTLTRYIDLLGALALAGGTTDFADVGNIVILRRVGDRNTVIHARLSSILKGKPSEEDLASPTAVPQLLAGDTVIVP